MDELKWRDQSNKWKDVYVVFIGNVKDVILKKVAAIRLAPDSAMCHGADEWVFKSPNGSEFVFNNRYIVQVQIVPHGCEIPISATRDEITYDFSDEEYMPEPSKPEPIDPNCSGVRVLVKEDISDGSVELEHYNDKKEEEKEDESC